MYVFSVRNLPYCVIFIELPYLRQTPRGVKNIDELRASTVGSRELKMSMRYWWLSNSWKTRQKLLTARRIRLYMAMLTWSASIRGLADDTYCLERSTLAMSNSEELYAGKYCTHVLSASSSCIFCSINAAIILEGWPKPDLLAMQPVSWHFFYL